MPTERFATVSDAAVVLGPAFAPTPALADFWALTKPDINFLVAVTTWAGFFLGPPAASSEGSWTTALHTLVATILAASGAAVLNQWMEHPLDARMRRTARRAIAAGRVTPNHALTFGLALSAAGVIYLGFAAGALAAALGAFTLVSYLLFYTPLKRVTPLCTLAGAIPGAVPPLIGAAGRGRLDHEAWLLFALVFLWQFPHFMAIAWMYKDDYDRAGYRVLPSGSARGPFVTVQTVLPLLGLTAVSLLLPGGGESRAAYWLPVGVLNLGFLYAGTRFVHRRSGAAARRLLIASIVYLPALLALALLTR
jgi:protoheme IX farnesyltransferase